MQPALGDKDVGLDVVIVKLIARPTRSELASMSPSEVVLQRVENPSGEQPDYLRTC